MSVERVLSPTYPGSVSGTDRVHVLNVERLQPGDIILTTSAGDVTRDLQRTLTGSRFSHAVLVVEPPDAIESSDWGVVKFRMDRFLIRDPHNVRVRRLSAARRKQFNVQAALHHAGALDAVEYSDGHVLTAMFTWIPQREPGKCFCAQLVAGVFRAGGIDLAPDCDTARVTPAMLAGSSDLEDVDGAMSQTLSSNIVSDPAWLDGASGLGPYDAEVAARQKTFALIRPVFARYDLHPATFYDAVSLLIKASEEGRSGVAELDAIFSRAMLDNGLLQLYPQHYPAHADAFFLDFYVRTALRTHQIDKSQSQTLLAFYRNELHRLRDMVKARDADSKELRGAYLTTQLESVRLQLACMAEAAVIATRLRDTMQRTVEILELFPTANPGPQALNTKLGRS